jgi:hypothetical protein
MRGEAPGLRAESLGGLDVGLDIGAFRVDTEVVSKSLDAERAYTFYRLKHTWTCGTCGQEVLVMYESTSTAKIGLESLGEMDRRQLEYHRCPGHDRFDPDSA